MTPSILLSPMSVTIDCSQWATSTFDARSTELVEWLAKQPRARRMSVTLPARQDLRPLRSRIQSLGCRVTVRSACCPS